MHILISSLLATLLVSLISLVGVFSLLIKESLLDKILILLVGFSAGALLGGAFFHLIPEAAEMTSMENVSMMVVIGISLFFLIERGLHWHHCHKHGGDCDVHMFTYMNLIGDGVHNLIDGMIITASFIVSTNLGIATTLAVITHEIPQELGDFGVLLYGGFSKGKALLANFLSAITAMFGAVLTYFLYTYLDSFIVLLLPFAAGGFIYIAASDLIPELHREPKLSKSLLSFGMFFFGIILMVVMKMILE